MVEEEEVVEEEVVEEEVEEEAAVEEEGCQPSQPTAICQPSWAT